MYDAVTQPITGIVAMAIQYWPVTILAVACLWLRFRLWAIQRQLLEEIEKRKDAEYQHALIGAENEALWRAWPRETVPVAGGAQVQQAGYPTLAARKREGRWWWPQW